MTSFSRFQERNKKRTVANNKLNTNYIFKGYPSIEIKGSSDQKVQASVVNKQEKDYAYVFTPLADNLSIGSVWTAKNLHLLITEEITIIKDVDWHKYHALLCNVQIDNHWGYFKGPEKSFLDVALEKEVVWESPQKPVLVLPENVLNFRDKIVIKGRAWLIQEYDAISTPGLVYYSLKPTTISKEVAAENEGKSIYVEKYENRKPEIVVEPSQTYDLRNNYIKVAANMPITVNTQYGYFQSNNSNIKIQKRTSDTVIFSIPFGVEEVSIEVKEKGDLVTKTYRVV